MTQKPSDTNAPHEEKQLETALNEETLAEETVAEETMPEEAASEFAHEPADSAEPEHAAPHLHATTEPEPAPVHSAQRTDGARAAAIGGIFGAIVASGVIIGAPFVFPGMFSDFLAKSLPKPSADPAIEVKFAAIDGKITTLEGAVKARPDLTEPLARLTDRVKALETVAADAFKAASASTAKPSPDLSAVESRLAKLEAVIAAPKAELRVTAEPDAAVKSSGNAAALAIVADVLNQTIAREAPFATELNAAESLGADPAKIAVLKPFADKGLPTNRALAEAFAALAPSLLKDEQALQPGFFDRLLASASKLVKISTSSEPTGDDPASLMARIGSLAAKGKLSDALALQASLPQSARDKSADWAKSVQTRLAAEAAAQALLNESLSLLAKPKN